MKIVTWSGETISFLEILGSLYDTFGIHSEGMKPEGLSLKQAKQNATKTDNYVRGTVNNVKLRKVTGCVSVSLLKRGMDRLYMDVIDVDPEFADDVLLERME